MKSILIPTNFSRQSHNAVEYILDLFRYTTVPCRLLLVNTYLVPSTDPRDLISVNDRLKLESRRGLEDQKAIALKKISQSLISIDTTSQFGSLNNVILQLIKKENIDMVAMGKHVQAIADILKENQCPLLITSLKKDFTLSPNN